VLAARSARGGRDRGRRRGRPNVADATALVWADPNTRNCSRARSHDRIDWVQLPYAGIEPFIHLLDRDRIWTCGKGVYARPVAEHVLALILAGFHNLGPYARATSWSGPVGRNLHGGTVLVLGGGGIVEELVPLLRPFGVRIVVRPTLEPRASTASTT
jgi:phosphoglycerate dehydrogenase-like enzyme